MNKDDKELLLGLLDTNFELNKLYEEHVYLEQRLDKFSKRSYLTGSEEIEVKLLKSRKLEGRDRMMRILKNESEEYVAA